MTTPTEPTPPPTSTSTTPGAPPPPGRGDRDMPIGLGMVPGNAELVVWLAALVVAALVCWIADTLGSGDWFTFFAATSVAYLLSRGIAKASRVYEY